MAVDVQHLLSQYEEADDRVFEPMHGRPGEIRRAPSTDQKKKRREMARKADLEDEVPDYSEADLLRMAAKASSLAEQRELVAAAEQLRTEKIAAQEAAQGLDLVTAKINDHLVPGRTHELVTASTDWLVGEVPGTLQSQASLTDACHQLVAEATLWFGRVSDDVKAHSDEFEEQAKNKSRHLASAYGDNAEAAAQAFIDEANRLHRQATKNRLSTVASRKQADFEEWPGVMDKLEPAAAPAAPEPPAVSNRREVTPLHPDIQHASHTPVQREHPYADHHIDHLKNEYVDRWHGGHDVGNLEGYSDAFVNSQLNRAASLSRESAATEDEDAAEELFGDDTRSDDSKTAGLQRTAASTLDEVAGREGFPETEFATFTPQHLAPEPDTSSNRAPALQEIQNYKGWDGTSVVPQGDSGAASKNDDTSGTQDASANDALSGNGFPVGASITGRVASMTEHAQCPTCGGQGKVAVRKLAYSGLPQIDQIVNADESPGTEAAPGQSETYPSQVAFPITGLDPNNVQRVISETEQQIGARPQGRPGAPGPGGPGGSVAASRREANGRDNSGWSGDQGAKGVDYPGYSSPTGYDGSTNLGQPDPVYGYGGDNGNQPHLPYGAQEAPDFTNDPGEPYDPSTSHDDGQAYRSVTPSMSTSGSRDPFIAAAQQEIVRQQQLIAQRNAMNARQAAANAAPVR